MDLLTLLLLVFIALGTVLFIRWRGTKSSSQLQSNSSHSSIKIPGANIQNTGQEIVKAGGLIPFVHQLHSKHGPVVAFWVPDDVLNVSINDPAILKPTLKIGDRPTHIFRFLEPLLGPDNLQVAPSDQAKNLRRQVSNCFSFDTVKSRFDLIKKHGYELYEFCKISSKEEKNIYLQKDFLQFGLRFILDYLCDGSGFITDIDEYKKNYDAVLNDTFDSQFESFKSTDKLKKSIEWIDKFYIDLIEHRKVQIANGIQHKDFLEILLTENNPNTNQLFTKEEISCHLKSWTLAGYHTTIVSISWIIFEILTHEDQKIQEKIQNEIDNVVGDKQDIDYSDLEKLQYLTQVCKESFRVKSPGSFAARINKTELELGGYVIPKNTTILYPLSGIHKNPELWKEPTKFDPDRFSAENIKSIRPNSWVPFGMGPRACPGDRLSLVELKLFLCVLFQHFNFKLVSDPKQVVPVERFVLWAANDILVQVSERK